MRVMHMPDYVRHEGSEAVGRRDGRAVQARRGPLVRRLAGGVRPALREMVDAGTFIRLERGAAPEQLPGPLRPERRGPRRGPHVHLLEDQGRRRSDEQLDGPGRDEGDPARAVRRLHGRAHDVRHPVQHGPARLADRPNRRADHRFALRRRQHEDHDPHGRAAVEVLGRRRVRPVPAHGRHAAGTPAQEDVRGRATPTTSTSSTSPRSGRSGATAAATAATPCWARSAWPCASPRRWPATRAGSPSTC